MIPIYFPFTYVSSSAVARLERWFDELGILAPAADAPGPSGHGSLTWRLFAPPPGEEAILKRLEAEWRRWADMHAGADLAAVMAAQEADGGFATAPAINSLRSRIRAGAGEASTSPGEAPLPAARVFLHLAHCLDQDQDTLREQLHHVADLERRMHQEIDGGTRPDSFLAAPIREEDPGAVLTQRRLTAWARLALALSVPADVLVTDSPAVIDHLIERLDHLDPIRDLDPDEVQGLPRSIRERLDSGGEATVFTVYAAPLSPTALLHRLAGSPGVPVNAPQGASRCLLVLITEK